MYIWQAQLLACCRCWYFIEDSLKPHKIERQITYDIVDQLDLHL